MKLLNTFLKVRDQAAYLHFQKTYRPQVLILQMMVSIPKSNCKAVTNGVTSTRNGGMSTPKRRKIHQCHPSKFLLFLNHKFPRYLKPQTSAKSHMWFTFHDSHNKKTFCPSLWIKKYSILHRESKDRLPIRLLMKLIGKNTHNWWANYIAKRPTSLMSIWVSF